MRKLFFILVLLPLFANSQSGITFQVEELERPKELLHERDASAIFEGMIWKDMDISPYDREKLNIKHSPDILSQSIEKDNLVNNDIFHPFFSGMYQAYADHRPFVLSPDMIWLLIAQGFSQHVNNNAEQLRHHFVNYEGKSSLVVLVGSDFNIRGRADWEAVFPQFSDKIGKVVGKELAENITSDFSTTTIASKVASEITLMETMKSYFEYIVIMLICGIPEITLEGTPEDWQKLVDKANYLRQYELDWWIDELEPVLKQFVKTSKGEVDKIFWMNMFKVHTKKEYGNPKIFDGWIVKFFPYDKEGRRNDLKRINNWNKLPKEIVNVDVKFIELNNDGSVKRERLLEAWAGFIGLQQNKETYALKPEIGWMVVEKNKDLRSEAMRKLYEEASQESFGGINIRVETVPEEILMLEKIKKLSVDFIKGIRIPDKMKNIEIERLDLKGDITPEEIERICKMFPKTYLRINGEYFNQSE